MRQVGVMPRRGNSRSHLLALLVAAACGHLAIKSYVHSLTAVPAPTTIAKGTVRTRIPGARKKGRSSVMQPLPPDDHARSALAELEDFQEFAADAYWTSDPATLSLDAVKEVKSLVVEDGKVSSDESPPKYERQRKGYLEQDPGAKVPPKDETAYIAHMEKRCDLASSAEGAGVATDGKDIVADRSVLEMLTSFACQEMDEPMKKARCFHRGTDMIRISKMAGSKALFMDRLFDEAEMVAEYGTYRGGAWRRKEVSQRGSFLTSLIRMLRGDFTNMIYTIDGRKSVAGVSAGELPQHYRFLEYDLGGLSLLTRAPVHASLEDGGHVEVRPKTTERKQEITRLETYMKMLLGGIDMSAVGFHTYGKLDKLLEVTPAQLLEKEPLLEEVAAKRLGRLVGLLKEIKEAVEKDGGEGPWVLQFYEGRLRLGKYVPKAEEAEAEAEAVVEEEKLEAVVS
mmetsp:Transcript_10502/g.19000  ORF Transcript_10502/g.19000 Transcript_10502/m.19000 type:complete len:454 (+) Transcript_10502:30-1391(+)